MTTKLYKRILSSIVLAPIVLFFIIEGSYYFNFFLLVCFFIAILEWHNMSKDKFYNIYGFLFIILSFYSIYLLRNNFDKNYFYLLFVTIICISTDLGGFIFGKIFKGPKLTIISPKKTYTGMFGAFILSIVSIYIFLNIPLIEKSINFSFKTIILVIIISGISQLGDIFISYFKRKSNIKDTGKIIPGHGGLLDRIDGMIFAFPLSFVIFLINNNN